MLSPQDLFSYVPLTEMVTRVMGGIPKVLPEQFFSSTRDVPGDRYRRATFRGTRQLSRVSRYGSPPRNTQRVGRGMQDLVMLHTIEQIQVSHELLMLLRKFDDYTAQQMARDLLQQDATEFARRMDNLEVAAVTASLAYGKLWFDADGNLQTSNAGADLEIDYGIPAENKGAINPGSGAIISASWATASTDIPTQILNLKTYARQKTGYEIKYAFYGKNVAGYLANNEKFKYYLARNPGLGQKYLDTGTIPDGVLGLTWIPVQDSFFADGSNAIVEIFPEDQVTFYPEINETTYQLMRGGYPVPKSFATAPTLEGITSQMDYVYGPFRYGYMMPGQLQINMAQGNTFLPDHKIPESIFIADVTP